MDKTFNPAEFINDLSSDLIASFGRAGRATTPALVGTAREKEVRQRLETLLPNFVGVGTGCVIDTSMNTSKQSDIILYEKDFCPVFSVGDTPESCYYPCEGVIAVGEVKSSLNSEALKDSFEKIESVKALRRLAPNPRRWKMYGSKLIAHGAESEVFDQERKYYDQIYGFILCGSVELAYSTLLRKYIQECDNRKLHLVPNLTVSLQNGLFSFLNKSQLWHERRGSQAVIHIENQHFGYLLRQLLRFVQNGRTVVMPVEEYLRIGNSDLKIGERIFFDE